MIRMVNSNDSNEIAEIYNHYVLSSTATFEEQAVSSIEMNKRIEKVQRQGLPWLASVVDNKIEGYAYASKWNPRTAYRFTVEISVYVSPEKVSKGTGTILYGDIFTTLKEMSIRQAIAMITLPNERSVALHEKLGMKKVAHLEHVGLKFGQWLDVGYWQSEVNSYKRHEQGIEPLSR